jgi:hypothetical protein
MVQEMRRSPRGKIPIYMIYKDDIFKLISNGFFLDGMMPKQTHYNSEPSLTLENLD